MTQHGLPFEVEGLPLRFADLVDVLRKLAGIRLIARVTASGDGGPSEATAPVMTLAGELGEPELGTSSVSVTVSVGDPEGESGGVLRLPSAGLRAATLSTFDGNDFFIIRLEWSGILVLIQDEASGVA